MSISFSGECALNKSDRSYGLLAKLAYLTRYSKAFRKTFLKTMEGYLEDTHESLTTDISTCYKTVTVNGVQTLEPINVQGQLAKDLTNKKEHNFLIQMICPLQHLDSLLPNQLDIGVELQFCDSNRFFVSSETGAKPKLNIKGWTWFLFFSCYSWYII